ncbi:hypothetical protein FOCC_FOCC012232 [Frankliniella occidentalis]|nr:hypothetical protein FOCC_FOCC012232 [Frankliniella occidentalis]
MMLLRLQSKSFLTATTLQYVTEAIRVISDHAIDYQKKVFRDLAKKYNVEDHVRAAIEDEVFNNSLHEAAVGDHGVLRSEHIRKKYNKEQFDLLEPVEYVLDNGVEKHKYHYVPIKKSYASLLKDKSVQKLYNKKETRANVLQDFEDGTAFEKNQFFIQNPNGIKIILYMDAFEPCEALKAARGKHKILAVYASLGNMPAYCRSARDPIQLVMLVKNTVFQDYSYEQVFAPLFEDLRSLHDEGIEVSFDEIPQIFKGCLIGISADNLEAHTVGGFNQGFSKADYYCRFRNTKRAGRLRGDISVCAARTCTNYDRDADLADEADKSVRGVWEHSAFNSIPDFHVVNGLPPCLAHDVPEGFIPKDLFSALKTLVQLKWFSWGYLNAKVKMTNGKGSSTNIRKIKPESKKIIGSASSNLRLLQIITLALVEKVQDPNHDAWQMIVTLQQFMALVCAPVLSVDQTFHIDVLGEKYIYFRQKVLPGVTLKCKHHYILHYGALTRKYGPLQRWSTIRFEAKHQYFKQASKSSHNFINPTLSLSNRHQYLQAYLREGNLYPTVVEADSVFPFKHELYSQEVVRALQACCQMSSPLFSSTKARYRGITYSLGDILMIKSNDNRSIISIFVDIIIISESFSNLIFIGSEKFIKYHLYFGVYEVLPSPNLGLISCAPNQIASPDPLLPVNIGEPGYTYLKHTIAV